MNIDSEELRSLVCGCLIQLREDLSLAPLETLDGDTSIFGSSSDLDSMALVHLIVDIEGRLQERYGRTWILADERAMSRNRSPFASVDQLCSFIVELNPEE